MKKILFIITLFVIISNTHSQQHCFDYMLLNGAENLITFGTDTTQNWWAVTEPFSETYKLIINGFNSNPYKEIRQLVFSPNGKRWAFFGKDNTQWYLNTNDTIMPLSASDVGQIEYSPNSQKIVYSYYEGFEEIIVIGNRKIKAYQREIDYNAKIYLSNNAERYAWVSQRGSGYTLNINGTETNVYDEIRPIGFWYDAQFLYACRNGDLWELFKGNESISENYSQIFETAINLKGDVAGVLASEQSGKQVALLISDEFYEPLIGNRYDYVSNLVLHPYLPMIAYNANLHQVGFVVLNNTEYTGGKEQTGTPEFTHDGEDLYYVGCDLNCFVNINGRKYPLHNEILLDRYYAKKPGSNTICYVTSTSMIVRDIEINELYAGMMVDNIISPRYNWRTSTYETLGSIGNKLYLMTCRF